MPESPERVVLWRLVAMLPEEPVVCAVQSGPTGLELRIQRDGELHLSETYRDQLRLIERSREMRQTLIEKGWTETDDL